MKTVDNKPEYMTILSGNQVVPKTHPRIAFRGTIDILEAEVIEAQALASELNEGEFCGYLGEILDCLRAIMSAEVKETPLAPPCLFGMDAEVLHSKSHNAGGKFFLFPSYTQGPLAARINTLRAKVREAELLAVKVFGPKEECAPGEYVPGECASSKVCGDCTPEREDIILALNRLSSALWWLFCEKVSIMFSEGK